MNTMAHKHALLTLIIATVVCIFNFQMVWAYGGNGNSQSHGRSPPMSYRTSYVESFDRAQRRISLMEENPTLTMPEIDELISLQIQQEQIQVELLRLEQEQALQAEFVHKVQQSMKYSTWNYYSDVVSRCMVALFLGGMMLKYAYGSLMAKYKSLSTPEGRRRTWIQLFGVSSFGLFYSFCHGPWARFIQVFVVAAAMLYLAFDIHRYFYQHMTAQQRRRQRQAARRRRQDEERRRNNNDQQGQQQRRRRARPCAKPYILESLPIVQVTETDLKIHGQCPMCFEDFVVGDVSNEVRRLPCSHLYHDQCIEPWLLNQNCTCPVCAWEFPTDDAEFNKDQAYRMKHRKPRYYRYEFERTAVRELKQWLPEGDTFQAIEKADLFQHLSNIGAIEVVEESGIEDDSDN